MWTHIPAEPLLSMRLLLRAWATRGEALSGPYMHLSSHARWGIVRWVRERRVFNGTLYVPAYICVEAVEPLQHLGQRVCFYPVLKTLEPDWTWLTNQTDVEAKAFLLVHYFGFPNAIERALRFCRDRGLLLLEDCAHSFLTRHEGRLLGTFGDGAVFSFRKILPMPDGGGLLIPRDGASTSGAEEEPPILGRTPYFKLAKGLIQFWLHSMRVSASGWLWFQGRYASTRSHWQYVECRPMAGISYRLMKALEVDFDRVIGRRRNNYLRLLQAFRVFPETAPLYAELLDGVCPYLFPVRVPNRDETLNGLWARGIPAQGWPTLPHRVSGDSRFEFAQRYASELLMLPVHQDIRESDVEQMVCAYREVREMLGVRL